MAKMQFGMIGLGVMGQNFSLNVERNGFPVVVYDINSDTVAAYLKGPAAGKRIAGARSIKDLVSKLETPRRIMILVPAGKPVDAVLSELQSLAEPGDIIIDGGNSNFNDTERRSGVLGKEGLHFFGMGVSGGEEGALWGPSLMPGGVKESYPKIESLLNAVAAKAEEDGQPCVTYIGSGGAGHFVKMVHNGIEYGDMQLIAESYDLLKRALNLDAGELHRIFSEWNEGELSSFLIEISAEIFRKTDPETGRPLVEMILDKAGQKGTGRWTSQTALEIGAPIPTITAAVDGRIISSFKDERVAASKILKGQQGAYKGDKARLIDAVKSALYASKICSYAQGMTMLRQASDQYGFELRLSEIARIWRAGCIIRARLLNDISRAYQSNPKLPNLLLDEFFQTAIKQREAGWRFAVCTAIELGIPMPGMSASLAYYDSYRSECLPANLIQAQRDFFGAHTYKRTDKEGTFHTKWEE